MKELFKMAAGRHLEYLCPRYTYRSCQVQVHYEPPYVAWCQISTSLYDFLWFSENYDNRLWLSDAILNVLFLKVVIEICKTKLFVPEYWEVVTIIHFCFMKDEDFMNYRIIQNGCRTPSWISLFQWELQILASTHLLWTFICSFLPNFILALWYFMILGKIR